MAQSEYRRLKSRLSRRVNAFNRERTLDNAERLFSEAAYGMEIFEAQGYPDDWHRWNIAMQDAATFIQLERWNR